MAPQLNFKIISQLQQEALELLQQLISIPSFSKEENATADCLEKFLQTKGVTTHRLVNNVWAFNQHFDPNKPTLLLNSHHDTVKPNSGYSLDPFTPTISEGKLYGLGSNDAGGALVGLLATFLYYHLHPNLAYNFIYAATAEEEISGQNGIARILDQFPPLEFAIVGEPTEMHLATAEKGLMVLDCTAHGTSAHAAHANPDNAIVNALPDLQWLTTYQFPKISDKLGSVKMSVTLINSGTQHNVIPNQCNFTIDVRTTDCYTNTEVLETIRKNIISTVTARSVNLNSSYIPHEHAIVQAGIALGRQTYGSPTTSDQAVIPYPSLKMGPGLSTRSHSSNEYIFVHEVLEGIEIYIQLLSKIL